MCGMYYSHLGRDGVSNHQPHDYLLNRLFRRRTRKTSKLCVTGLVVTGEFPAQMAINAENVPIWWRHHAVKWGISEQSSHHITYIRCEWCHCGTGICHAQLVLMCIHIFCALYVVNCIFPALSLVNRIGFLSTLFWFSSDLIYVKMRISILDKTRLTSKQSPRPSCLDRFPSVAFITLRGKSYVGRKAII